MKQSEREKKNFKTSRRSTLRCLRGLKKMKIPPVGIHLTSDATPAAVYAPRRIPLPLYDKAKAEIERMLEKRIIQKENEPTE